MQAAAAELSGYVGKAGTLRLHSRTIPLIFGKESLKTVCFDSFILEQAQHHVPSQSDDAQNRSLPGDGAELSSPE